jgi:hypothetical protein
MWTDMLHGVVESLPRIDVLSSGQGSHDVQEGGGYVLIDYRAENT